jgi:uncharacterized membrane protein YccC
MRACGKRNPRSATNCREPAYRKLQGRGAARVCEPLSAIIISSEHCHMKMEPIRKLIVAQQNPTSIEHSARTAVAAIASMLFARMFRLPEPYWAPITTLVVMQSTLGASLPISAQRFAGTALGAVVGGFLVTHFSARVITFGIAVLAIGIFCTALKVERSAYRYASITLAILLLVPRPNSGWGVALHRFLEVSIGIAVGLFVTAIWPEGEIASIMRRQT